MYHYCYFTAEERLFRDGLSADGAIPAESNCRHHSGNGEEAWCGLVG